MRIAVIILMAWYSFGTLFFPMGDLSYTLHLPEMYRDCSNEDPDITPADFVFGHLLNLEDVLSHFETGENEEHEKPHQLNFDHGVIQSLIVITQYPAIIYTAAPCYAPMQEHHATIQDGFIPSGHPAGVFRPPII